MEMLGKQLLACSKFKFLFLKLSRNFSPNIFISWLAESVNIPGYGGPNVNAYGFPTAASPASTIL